MLDKFFALVVLSPIVVMALAIAVPEVMSRNNLDVKLVFGLVAAILVILAMLTPAIPK